MANRTIYLPEELDEISRRLGLNLSRLTQEAIEAHVAQHEEAALEARVDAATERIAALGLDWPENWLKTSRDQAGER
jgi:post-segregation antitoxin (ccd killing protein)